jgi:carnitine 3-dehydrogenase
VLGADDKRLHVFHRMHRRGDDKLLATAEQLHLHVDTTCAKAAPVDAAVRGKLEALRAAHAALPAPPDLGSPVGSRAKR